MRTLFRFAAYTVAAVGAFTCGAYFGAVGLIRVNQANARRLAATRQAIELWEDQDD